MKKIIFTFIVALILMPVYVSAATVAKIGETPYESFNEALNAATSSSSTITLVQDVENVTIPNNLGFKLTIDLDQHKISKITNNGELVIQNGTLSTRNPNGEAVVNNTGANLIIKNVDIITEAGGIGLSNEVIDNAGTLTLQSSTFNNTLTGVAKFVLNHVGATTTIESGTYNATSLVFNFGNFLIKDGTFTCDDSNSVPSYNSGNITIENGSFTCTDKTIFRNFLGTLEIIDGLFRAETIAVNNATSHPDQSLHPDWFTNTATKIIVSGGQFTTTGTAFMNGAGNKENNTIMFAGGTITSDTEDYIIKQVETGPTDKDAIYLASGTIKANNSKGLYLCGAGNKFEIGTKEDVPSIKNPEINITSGNVAVCNTNTATLTFNGGIVSSKNVISTANIDRLTEIKVPTGYRLINTASNGYYLNYLDKAVSKDPAVIDNPTTDDVQSCRYDKTTKKYYNTKGEEITKEEWPNQCTDPVPTGSFIPYVALIGGAILVAASYIIVRKKSVLSKI